MKKKNKCFVDKIITSTSFEAENIGKNRIKLKLVMFDAIDKIIIEDVFTIKKNDKIEMNLVGFLSPRKLRTKFGITSKQSLYVSYFQYENSPLNIRYVYEFTLMTESQFSTFRKYTGLKVLEPPRVIVNMP